MWLSVLGYATQEILKVCPLLRVLTYIEIE